jgi:hypothetical protein
MFRFRQGLSASFITKAGFFRQHESPDNITGIPGAETFTESPRPRRAVPLEPSMQIKAVIEKTAAMFIQGGQQDGASCAKGIPAGKTFTADCFQLWICLSGNSISAKII